MNDALVFSNGYTSNPNPMLGMYLADYNFHRVGNILADLDARKRAAFQYLVRGLTLDELSFVRPDIDPDTNPTNHYENTYACENKIAEFFPRMTTKVTFYKFSTVFLAKLRGDYLPRKYLAYMDNMGLSKLGAGFDPNDPYDEMRVGRGLVFNSTNGASFDYLTFNSINMGYTEPTALYYMFYLMGLPSQDYSTAITRGDNMPVDANYQLTGSTDLSYGNVSRCYTPEGKPKSLVKPYDIKKTCISGPADEFFTQYLPQRFFLDDKGNPFDPELNSLTCDQLATRSKQALSQYLARQ